MRVPIVDQISLRIHVVWSECPLSTWSNPVSILYRSIAGRYRSVRVTDGLITVRYSFIKNASWEHCLLGYPKCARWRFCSDCANAQAELNPRWVLSEMVDFQNLRRISTLPTFSYSHRSEKLMMFAPFCARVTNNVINLSIIQDVVPDDVKSVRVVPLFKKNDKTEVGNYRPVSILSILSKVVEKVVYEQIEICLDDKKLLYKFQSGFRGRFSTDTCLIHLTDFIKFQMDKDHLLGMVLLDLQKAFDTVDHKILLMKMEALGLGQDVVRWFRSYLSDRRQLVDVSGVFSSSAAISCGVPQGSILGPLLFLIYVNDISGAVNHKLLLYADNSAKLVADKSVSAIEMSLQKELEVVWVACGQ